MANARDKGRPKKASEVIREEEDIPPQEYPSEEEREVRELIEQAISDGVISRREAETRVNYLLRYRSNWSFIRGIVQGWWDKQEQAPSTPDEGEPETPQDAPEEPGPEEPEPGDPDSPEDSQTPNEPEMPKAPAGPFVFRADGNGFYDTSARDFAALYADRNPKIRRQLFTEGGDIICLGKPTPVLAARTETKDGEADHVLYVEREHKETIFRSADLFGAAENLFLSAPARETLARSVTAQLQRVINEKLYDPQTPSTKIMVSEMAGQLKREAIKAFVRGYTGEDKNYESIIKSMKSFNQREAGRQLRLLGLQEETELVQFGTAQFLATPAWGIAKAIEGEEISFICLTSDRTQQSEECLEKAAAKARELGLGYRLDDKRHELILWEKASGEPDMSDWRSIRAGTAAEYDRALCSRACFGAQAIERGYKRKDSYSQDDLYRYAAIHAHTKGAAPSPQDPKLNREIAKAELLVTGLAFVTEMRGFSEKPLRMYQVDDVAGKPADIVCIQHVSKNELEGLKKGFEKAGITPHYDEASSTLYVPARETIVRPFYEYMAGYREPDYARVIKGARDTCAHTIGVMAAISYREKQKENVSEKMPDIYEYAMREGKPVADGLRQMAACEKKVRGADAGASGTTHYRWLTKDRIRQMLLDDRQVKIALSVRDEWASKESMSAGRAGPGKREESHEHAR